VTGGSWRARYFLEGLVEALDLAAGLRVVGPGVLGADAQGEQFQFQAAGLLVLVVGAEDQAVVGEERFRVAPGGGGFVQGADHVGGAGGGERVGGDTQPGVVIEDVEHLEHRPAGPPHMGDVGLPALVGELGREPHPGTLGPLVRLGRDETPGPQHPPDRRHRWRMLVPLGQMVMDGRGTRIKPGRVQILAQGGDLPPTARRPAWGSDAGAGTAAPPRPGLPGCSGPAACTTSCGSPRAPAPAR
jgi:hypothetical protein